LAIRRDEEIVVAVVIVVADRYADTVDFNVESGFVRDVSEGAVVIVVIKLGSGVFLRVPRPVRAVHKKNIRPAIVVVIDERNTRTHRLRQKLFSERSVVMNKMNSRFCGDILKRNASFCALRVCKRRKQKQERNQNSERSVDCNICLQGFSEGLSRPTPSASATRLM